MQPPIVILKELAGNPLPQLNVVQQAIVPHVELLVTFWISVWIMTGLVVVGITIKEYRNRKNRV